MILHYVTSALVILCACQILASCVSDRGDRSGTTYVECHGQTMGTTYTVKYADHTGQDHTDSIDAILHRINQGVSTYLPESVISTFNLQGSLALERRWMTDTTTQWGHFMQNLALSHEAFRISSGAFDPTVGPLVNLWGFGWEGHMPSFPDSNKVRETLNYIGLQKLKIDTTDTMLQLQSLVDGMQLDFSAVAKGYAVDRVAAYLELQGAGDYFVEIGGEVRTRGVSQRGSSWIVGINTPSVEAPPESIFARVQMSGMSMATSGNYRNFHEVDGKRTWHSINPETGYPEQNNLLSATVVHRRCSMADALATACMIQGLDGCLRMIRVSDNTEVFLIYADGHGNMREVTTSGFNKYLADQ